MTATDNAEDLPLFVNITAQTESLLHSLEQVAGGICLYVNANKAEFMCFKQEEAISTLNRKPLKLVAQQHFVYWKWC